MKYEHLLNKEYSPGGIGPDSFDCYHLVREIQKERGYNLPMFEVEGDELSLLQRIIADNIDSVVEEIPEIEEGCLVALWIRPKRFTHIGIATKENGHWYMIHILKNSKVTKERLDNPLWSKRVLGYYKVKEKYATKREST